MERTLDISHQNINLTTIDMKYVFVPWVDLAFDQRRPGYGGAQRAQTIGDPPANLRILKRVPGVPRSLSLTRYRNMRAPERRNQHCIHFYVPVHQYVYKSGVNFMLV